MLDKIIVKNINYLLCEEYKNDNKLKIRTIDYLTSFVDINTLINYYKSHLDELLEYEELSGNFLNDKDNNNLNRLHIKIRIADEYRKKVKKNNND